MRVLLVLRQNKNLEAFLGVIRSLLDRGHHVTTAIQEWDDERDRRVAAGLPSGRFAMVQCPPTRLDGWAPAATLIRSLRDCAHYLRPELRDAVKLQARTVEKLRQKMELPARPAAVAAFLRQLTPVQVEEWETVLALAEGSVPIDPILAEFVSNARPDVVLVSPLIHFGSAQADVIATAERLGIATGMLLYSWDNLSTKGCLHRVPDRMFVWNEQQREEARAIHGYPADRVTVVGAPRFDEFFELRPMLSREVFHEGLGLDPSRPTLLYLCSSRFVTKEELPFVRRWIGEVRSFASEPLRSANIIVRPHPDIGLLRGSEPTENRKISHLDALRVRTARPFGDPAAIVLRTSLATPHGLFESIFHSAAVVGLNTTAELEAGIIGRPVFTILAEEKDVDGQQTTLHFHYLLKGRGGFVSVGRTFAEHLAQLDAALSRPVDPGPIRAFIREFLRPHGLDRPVGPIYAEAIEEAYVASGFNRTGVPVVASGLSRTSALHIDVHASPELTRQAGEGTAALDEGVVQWLQQSVAIGDVVYDIGAGVGLATIFAARHRGAVVVAFESGYGAFARLCDNVRLNGCQDAVIPLPVALSSEDGLKELKYETGQEGQERHRLGSRDWRVKPIHSDRMYVQPVCVSPLDAIVRRHGLPPPNHLRLASGTDVLRILEGAREMLASPSLKSLLFSADPQVGGDAAAMLRQIGWDVEDRRPAADADAQAYCVRRRPTSSV